MAAVAMLAALAADAEPVRMVCFGPVPAVVAFDVTIDGRTIEENRRLTAEALVAQLDADADGRLTREEAAGLEPLPGDDPRPLSSLWPKVDADADDRLSAAEVHALLDRTIGPTLTLQRIEGVSLSDLSLETFLDADADGRITPEEYDAGFRRLRRVDFDDDQTLSAAELIAFAKASEAENGRRRLLARAEDAAALLQIAGPVPNVPESWKRRRWREIDADGDGEVAHGEAVAWAADAAADLVVRLQMASESGNRIGLEVGESRLRPLRPSRQRRRTRVDAKMGDALVEFRVSNSNFVASDGRDFLLLRHRVADADRNGYLGPEEYERMDPRPAPFEAVDRDGDQMLFKEELAKYLEDVQRLAQLQVRLDVRDATDGLFDRIDRDIDRRLSPREVMAMSSGTGSAEDGREIRVTASTDAISFFGEDDGPSMAQRQLPVVRDPTAGPEWFRRMDRNRDGDLTWREFLGPKSAFEKLDADADGFVTPREADAAARP